MKITIDPVPFDPAAGYTIELSKGTPPYTFDPFPEPPNPPGVEVQVNGDVATVTVPPSTPPGTEVLVLVADSSNPPKSSPVVNRVA